MEKQALLKIVHLWDKLHNNLETQVVFQVCRSWGCSPLQRILQNNGLDIAAYHVYKIGEFYEVMGQNYKIDGLREQGDNIL